MEFSDDENEIISQENFEKAEQEKKEYFEDGTMIGLDALQTGRANGDRYEDIQYP